MTIDIKPDGTVTFELTIPWSELQTTYQLVLQTTAQQITLPGFRKGKAPLSLVEKNVHKNKLYLQALEKLLPAKYQQIIVNNKLRPLITPQITPLKMDMGQDWLVKIETAVSPQVKLGDYQTYLKKALANFKNTSSNKVKAKQTPSQSSQSKQQSHHKNNQDNQKLTLIFDTLLKNAQISVSPLLVDQEVKHQLSHLVHQLDSLHLTIQDYAKSLHKTPQELIKDYQQTATTNLKLEFILAKLIELEKPDVSQELNKLKVPPAQKQQLQYSLQRRQVIDKLLKL